MPEKSREQEKPPLPPFTEESAALKVRLAEDAWNSREPVRVSMAYSEKSEWRNRSQFLRGRAEIVDFLTQKWRDEREYRLVKELWAFRDHRIAVRFAYEYQDVEGRWFRAYGNENWEFDELGLMKRRVASINDLALSESERKLTFPQGRRPDDFPSLTELGL